MAVLHGHERPVDSLAYSPDGQRICSAGRGSGRLWDAATRAADRHPRGSGRVPQPPASRPTVGGLSSARGQVCLWDATSGRQISVLGSHDHEVVHLAVSPDGKRIASHGETMRTPIRLGMGYRRPRSPRCAAIWSTTAPWPSVPTGRVSSSGSTSIPTTACDCGRRRPAGRSPPCRATRIRSVWVAFSPDGRRIVSASHDRTAWLWDGLTGAVASPSRPHGKRVERDLQPRCPADRHRLGRSDASPLGRDLRRPGRGAARTQGGGPGAAFAPHGSLLVSRSIDGESRVWDMDLAERNGILAGTRASSTTWPSAPTAPRGVRGLGWHGSPLGCDQRPTNGPLLRHEHGHCTRRLSPRWPGTPAAASSPP